MATGRRRGRAIIYLALILILVFVLLFAVLRSGLFGGLLPGANNGATPSTGEPSISQSVATVEPTPEKIEIWVVSQEIRRGEKITRDRVVLYPIDREKDTEEFFHKDTEDEFLDRRALYDLKPETSITAELFAEKGSSAGVPSFEIPPGMVAISVPVSKLSAVSYGLQKGDRVNVIVSLLFLDLDTNWQSKLPNRTGLLIGPGPLEGEDVTSVTSQVSSGDGFSNAPFNGASSYLGRIEIEPAANAPVWVVQGEASRPRLVSQTLIQDVVVLQTGYFGMEQEQIAAPQAEGTPQPGTEAAAEAVPAEAPAAPQVVTLIVTPQDAVTLNYLLLAGANMNLVLRGAGDGTRMDTEAVTLQFLMDQYRIPNPAKLPYGTEPRIDSFPDYVPVFPEPGPSPTPGQ